jgi:hypothetical protein
MGLQLTNQKPTIKIQRKGKGLIITSKHAMDGTTTDESETDYQDTMIRKGANYHFKTCHEKTTRNNNPGTRISR